LALAGKPRVQLRQLCRDFEEERMKLPVRCLVLSIVIWGMSFLVCAQAPTKGNDADRKQILQLERDWTQSFVTMDVAANQRIVADDFLGTETDGKRITKADIIAAMKTEEALASNHLNEDDVTIRVYGQSAVVNGSESWKSKDGKTGRRIWTDVFVKRNGKWQVVASQDMEAKDR
jgi:hypothetical protein